MADARREKLDALIAAGLSPYAYAYDRTHTAAAALESGATLQGDAHGERVRIAGRLVSWRSAGKTAFAHVADATARCARGSDVTASISSRIEQESRDSGNKTDVSAV